MGKRGPKKTPTAIKLLAGTHRADRDGDPAREPVPKAGQVRVPAWAPLGDVGKKVWKDTLDRIPDGVATKSDVHMLVQYCKAWELFLTAEAQLAADGLTVKSMSSGALTKHPATQVLESARCEVRRIAGLFGLSPSDRMGLKIEPKKSGGVSSRRRA